MNAKKPQDSDDVKLAAMGLPKRQEILEDDESEDKKERKVVRQTFHIPPAVHEQIREYCHEHQISQAKFYRKGIDMLFIKLGLPTWNELAPPKRK